MLWMLGFVVIRSKKNGRSVLNHTPCACVQQRYEVTSSIKRSGMHELDTHHAQQLSFQLYRLC